MKIAIIGLGTIGSGVLDLIERERCQIEKRIGAPLQIVWLCDRNSQPQHPNFTTDYNQALRDPEVETVIELIGGIDNAYHIALSTLSSGKNLITANKHLLALHGEELFELANQHGVKLFFEAAVGGGIPLLTPLYEGLFSGDITRVRGILNGTANYILTQMHQGQDFESALTQAQQQGYAEADPHFDLAGIDSAHKLSLLSYLTWQRFKTLTSISVQGIDSDTQSQISAAQGAGQKLKLIAEAERVGNEIRLSVAPTPVKPDDLLYGVDHVYNAVEIQGRHSGKTLLYGEGAGKYPTATAVISDLYKIAHSNPWNRET
ncbi:homoserine dehydrogenase [Dongshaea marina]|uniref:homoserine dehydrogenase n=1 Tax=Dongshaea marina TaxID=2047966 RepID=UPI000D3E1EAE|nr:homoserine dehydrogenase [Dongshaea marina]